MVTLKELIRSLGKSERTIKRRAERLKLKKRYNNNIPGLQQRIFLNSEVSKLENFNKNSSKDK